ncbi:PEP-utilizing enzyme, mobile domain-containing protein [Ditylenchus destructor]|uniref:PEP-utilizing enzyme, mobile domain-containing protein n=1 Tax=Ditylenchus destructor TaxID=166010 RepID=A0AAD4MEY5_9BILA|nr:PEP-utilizing enzyme, mobile domain-containing protein [Ditylenchus destructor]
MASRGPGTRPSSRSPPGWRRWAIGAAGRAADLRDVGRRVLAQLEPLRPVAAWQIYRRKPCILLAADLSPSDTANLDPTRVLGLATAQGGPTSHTAILSRTLACRRWLPVAPNCWRSRPAAKRSSTAAAGGSTCPLPRPICFGTRLDRRAAADPRARSRTTRAAGADHRRPSHRHRRQREPA